MPGYKHPCRYCGELAPPDANVCPFCGKVNPKGPTRCPRCRNPIRKEHRACSGCGLDLRVICFECMNETFFGDYCEHCGTRLLVVCPNKKCGAEQPPIGPTCVECGETLTP